MYGPHNLVFQPPFREKSLGDPKFGAFFLQGIAIVVWRESRRGKSRFGFCFWAYTAPNCWGPCKPNNQWQFTVCNLFKSLLTEQHIEHLHFAGFVRPCGRPNKCRFAVFLRPWARKEIEKPRFTILLGPCRHNNIWISRFAVGGPCGQKKHKNQGLHFL